MAIKNTIRAAQVKAGQAIFINFRAACAVAVELPALPDGVMWPSPMAMSERLLEWQRRGLQYTATGYGTKIPTSKVIRWSDGKVRRVYCDIYSNIGSCYCLIHGCKVSVDGFNLISEATR